MPTAAKIYAIALTVFIHAESQMLSVNNLEIFTQMSARYTAQHICRDGSTFMPNGAGRLSSIRGDMPAEYCSRCKRKPSIQNKLQKHAETRTHEQCHAVGDLAYSRIHAGIAAGLILNQLYDH